MAEQRNNPQPNEDDFEALLDQYMPENAPRTRGDLMDATVVAILDDVVLVTYGAKEETPIPIGEFLGPRGEPTVKPGDAVRLLMTGWDEEGAAVLSYTKARAAAASKMIEEAHARKVPVRGTVKRVIKGGVLVDVGMDCFMPASQVDLFRAGELESMVGQEIEAYVIDYDAERGRAVLSRRQLLQERKEKGRQEFIATVKAGDVVKGVVRDVLDFGVSVSLGLVEGMIPRSELSYERGVAPEDIVKPGQELELKVLDVSADTGKITLSRKRAGEDPWAKIGENYPTGSTVRGKVVSIQSFGAFVQLQEGLTGLIHAKDISWEAGSKSPQESFKVGDEVTCQVTDIDVQQRRLGLSLKHLSRDPWLDLEAKYPIGSRHRGTVTGLRDFGAFVKLDEYTEGLLHVGDMSWRKRIAHPSEVVQAGQELDVVVLRHDREKRRISLGIKQLEVSPFEQFLQEHPVGSLVKGKVSRFAGFGAFVELAPGLEGLIHVSEIDEHRVDSPEKALRMGEEITAKILEVNKGKQRISLSRRQAFREMERENIRQYANQEKSKEQKGGSLFGEALKNAVKKKP